MGILNNAFKPTYVQKFSRIKVYNVLLYPFFYVEEKYGPLKKRIKFD